ncbi:von Willebrand factor type A domain-containing protein [Lutibacter oricola]|uniref:von Willebrand factor type A domain-containing protein n=1 Tax=Lutibacter oricola TaxID=762486 RepID=A0A1H2TAM0_9FLAO|nr:vWA domain-containing protein [Lutibacter oricola]SDW40807.1 von Willebrand factor type A domain-containing protein [Lutibacter oricola]
MKTLLKLLIITLTISTFTCNANNPKAKQQIKVALLLDTSNSMDGLINQAKTQLWEIVNELSYAKCGTNQPDLQIALYEYGNDDLEQSDGFIRQVLNFSEDLDEISEKLFALKTNGGSEYCGQVINTSLKNLKWGTNKDDLKIIFIAGNEPFTQGKLSYKEAASLANEKDVTVNTIFCGNYENGISGKWQEGAHLTKGDYMTIDHNEKIVHIKTPYDRIIIEQNNRLNKTYISYGAIGKSKQKLQYEQDSKAEELDEEVVVKRAVSKSSRMYKNASWDLVDAVKDKKVDYAKLNKKSLPKHLQNKSTAELKKYVEAKQKERKEIQQKIQELNNLRKKYVATKTKTSKNKNLENALIGSIKKQAMKKNFSWR